MRGTLLAGARVVAALGVCMFLATTEADVARADVAWNGVANGNMGSITFSGAIVSAMSVTVDFLADSDTTGATLPSWNVADFPAGTVTVGSVDFSCGQASASSDCYVQDATTANYVHTFRATLSWSGGGQKGLEIYEAAAGTWPASTFYAYLCGAAAVGPGCGATPDWTTAAGTALPVAPAAGSGFQLVAGTNATTPIQADHQLALRITGSMGAGAGLSTLVTYRTIP